MNALPNAAYAPGLGDIRGAQIQRREDEAAARADAEYRNAEAIAADPAKVRQIVDDNIGNHDSPMCGEMAVDLVCNLRNLQPLLQALCEGDTVQQAANTPERMRSWRMLLAHAKNVDLWVDQLIAEEAEVSL